MALQINDSFQINSAVPIDVRLVLSKNEMLNVDENLMPDVYFAICTDGKFYLYNKTNSVDPSTGKFRVLEGGSSSDFADNFSIVEIKDDPSDTDKVTGYKIFTKGINEVTGDTELTNEILTASKIEDTLLDLSEFDKVTP